MDGKTDGQIAYEAYVEDCGGRSIHGEQLPSWAGQAPETRPHWEAAANAVRRIYTGEGPRSFDLSGVNKDARGSA